MPSGPLLSVVVPTRNEAANAPVLVRRLAAALAGVDFEICFVDDSDDSTPAILEELATEFRDRVRSRVRAPGERRGGLSTAVVTGLRMAAGRYVCVMDADLQHPPETVPEMLAVAQAGADLVVASRHVAGGHPGGLDGWGRRLVSRAATRLARVLFSEARRSTDPLSGFFLCHRALVDGVEFRPVGFKVLLELLVLLPGVEVREVPLRFASRAEGTSKASVGQGLQYLRHLRSLVLEVQGSARTWKFALVGASGLIVFLPLLAILAGPAGLPVLVAFLPAFVAALAWNTALNRLWTFADLRRHGDRPLAYLSTGLLAGIPMFGLYALLAGLLGWAPAAAGAVSVPAAGMVNGLANRPLVRRAPSLWARVVADRGAQATLERLATQIGADRVYITSVDRPRDADDLTGAIVGGAIRRRQAIVVTEAASYRPQRRTNVAAMSLIVVPVVADGTVLAAVVCERRAPHGFVQADLEAVTSAVHRLSVEMPAALGAGPAPVAAATAVGELRP